ncbi:hypothetical protein [Lederbergia graminis]|uniref:Lipoprotein n=1 Tax=Lederbergia graminis TaxID=735518 RepID=A0ABW0LJ48_9BACI
MRKLFMLLAVLLLLTACTKGKTQSLGEFFKDANVEHVEKVRIVDGSTGYKKTITDQEEIDTFISLIKDIEFSPQENQEKRDGWRYDITLFDGVKEFQFGLHKIDDVYYDSNPDILPIVDSYYKKQDIKEE